MNQTAASSNCRRDIAVFFPALIYVNWKAEAYTTSDAISALTALVCMLLIFPVMLRAGQTVVGFRRSMPEFVGRADSVVAASVFSSALLTAVEGLVGIFAYFVYAARLGVKQYRFLRAYRRFLTSVAC